MADEDGIESLDGLREATEFYAERIADNPYHKALTGDAKRTFVVLYFLTEWAGKDYVSLTRLAKEAGVSYDQAENYVTKFKAERAIPLPLHVLEEQEG